MERSRYLIGLILLTFFVISFLTNLLGPLVPEIIESFHLSLTLAGLLPFAFFVAYGLLSIPAGLLVERFGAQAVMAAAFGLALAASLVFCFRPGYCVAVGSLFLLGGGMAMLQVAANPLLRVAGGRARFAAYSLLAQLVFGLASFLSPLVYSHLVRGLRGDGARRDPLLGALAALVPPELPWLSLYWLCAGVCGTMLLVILASPFPGAGRAPAGTLAAHRALLRQPAVALYFLAIFAYVGTEQGVANWISRFLAAVHGDDPQTTGARTVSLF